MGQEVIVPARVFVGLEKVRNSGRVNMFDRRGVQRAASDLGQHALVLWLEGGSGLYSQGIFNGFAPDRELTDEEQEEIEA